MRAALLFAALVGASAMSARTAAAQEPRFTGRLSPAARSAVEAVLDSARQTGLPIEPLVDRALEGAAKGAADNLIVGAVRRLAADLGNASAALGLGASDDEIAAAASALRAGARAADLTALRERRPGRSVTVAAAVLTDLVALGVPPDTATAAVLAMADLADDAGYLAFRRNVERDVALGATPLAALTVGLAAEGTTDLGTRTPTRARKP
ncbi:MAG: hypothetical protein OEY20_10700 [Gemmatimonadota bacterium]|nr:hypothetical protein [Gemmatimonadota bacterium]MDH4349768.1 hypothetical protein [Gemmatimonadota bacterium]MDH5197711.1 hypothetical protein [Gemmatimonadota bacterium]